MSDCPKCYGEGVVEVGVDILDTSFEPCDHPSHLRREPDWRTLADALGEELIAAREDVLHWAAYADPYFKEKWNLAGDLARIDAMLRRWQEARGTGHDDNGSS